MVLTCLATTLAAWPSAVRLPWRIALAMIDAAWILRIDNIWHKTNAMPESVNDRLSGRHEYLFLFTRSPHYRFDHDAPADSPTGPGPTKAYVQQMLERYGVLDVAVGRSVEVGNDVAVTVVWDGVGRDGSPWHEEGLLLLKFDESGDEQVEVDPVALRPPTWSPCLMATTTSSKTQALPTADPSGSTRDTVPHGSSSSTLL